MLGRFLQTDPIGYATGVNLYTYCGNNPVVFIDAYGLCRYELTEREILQREAEIWGNIGDLIGDILFLKEVLDIIEVEVGIEVGLEM